MSFRTTLLLLLVLAGLGGYVYWVEYPQAQKEAQKEKVLDFSADDATELTLVYADREIALKKSGDDWRMSKPLDTAADAATVKILLGAIASGEIKKEVKDASSDLATYGLDKPFITARVKTKDKELAAISVGKTTPIGGSAYLQRSDDKKILLASSSLRSSLDKQVKDLRDKSIVGFSDDELQRVEVSGSGGEMALAKKDGAWVIERPAAFAADASNVRSFLSSLRAMRATDFPDDAPSDLSQYGLDAPQLTIRLLVGKDNAEKTIRFGSKQSDKKELYVQTSGLPTIYTVSEFSLKELSKGPNELRDKTVLAFTRDDAAAIDVRHKDGTQLRLLRGDDKQWRVEGLEGKPAAAANQYIGDVHELKGYEILADNPGSVAEYGLDQPMLTLRVSGSEQRALGSILIGERPASEDKKEFVAMAEGGSTVYLVRDYTVARLNKQASAFIEAPTPTPGGATPTIIADEMDDVGFGDEDLGDE